MNSHDLIKIIALILMVIDHVGEYLLNDNHWCRLLGRGAAPLFFFLVGYSGKLHLRLSLLLFGVVLSVTNYYLTGKIELNILLNFILIHYCLHFFPVQYTKTWQRIIGFVFLALTNTIAYFYIEYGFLGILIAYSARLLSLEDNQRYLWLILTLIVYFVWESLYFQFTMLPPVMFVFTFLTAGLFFIMSNYRLRSIPCPDLLVVPGLLVSRYSLEIYALHLLILEGCYYYLHIYLPR